MKTSITDATENRVYFRDFLNDEHGVAAIEVEVVTETWDRDDRAHKTVDGSCSITDCRRHVHLEFYVGDKEDLAKANRKIDRLVTALSRLKDALNAQYAT